MRRILIPIVNGGKGLITLGFLANKSEPVSFHACMVLAYMRRRSKGEVHESVAGFNNKDRFYRKA